jgi:hypothetical protein
VALSARTLCDHPSSRGSSRGELPAPADAVAAVDLVRDATVADQRSQGRTAETASAGDPTLVLALQAPRLPTPVSREAERRFNSGTCRPLVFGDE